jgi:hypothetical protein
LAKLDASVEVVIQMLAVRAGQAIPSARAAATALSASRAAAVPGLDQRVER